MDGLARQREPCRVLIVERPDGREMVKWVLERHGFSVDLADDGEAGLLAAAAHGPAVALIEIDVPKLDGWTLARAMRRLFGRRIALVAITSRHAPEDRQKSRAAGFDAHLVKPVPIVDIEITIRALVPSAKHYLA
jgi:DNA-binding response OmpR family regulator